MAEKNENTQTDLEVLVDELMKDSPNQSLVKKLSHKLGFSYSKNVLVQMNTVLEGASFEKIQKPQTKASLKEIGR
jgi:hypothetical protein